jgi:hypothetical protein
VFSNLYVAFLSAVQGGFYFHPSDKNPSPGIPVDEKAT